MTPENDRKDNLALREALAKARRENGDLLRRIAQLANCEDAKCGRGSLCYRCCVAAGLT